MPDGVTVNVAGHRERVAVLPIEIAKDIGARKLKRESK